MRSYDPRYSQGGLTNHIKDIEERSELVSKDRFTKTVCLFTEQNIEILLLLAEGLSAYQIGKKVGRSHRTVEKHIADMKMISECRNIPHLIAEAFRAGMIK
jgi:DNA-binding CsgD family transcriptional regulator